MKVWTLIVASILILISVEVMADDPVKTREAELEAELAECKAEVERLKNPPAVSNDEYMQKIQHLQQRINEAK